MTTQVTPSFKKKYNYHPTQLQRTPQTAIKMLLPPLRSQLIMNPYFPLELHSLLRSTTKPPVSLLSRIALTQWLVGFVNDPTLPPDDRAEYMAEVMAAERKTIRAAWMSAAMILTPTQIDAVMEFVQMRTIGNGWENAAFLSMLRLVRDRSEQHFHALEGELPDMQRALREIDWVRATRLTYGRG